jgi:glycosyltransferase involved in cell wall biosynthesis
LLSSSPKASGGHVAFLLPDLGGGGAERLTIDLMAGFVARGARVDLVLQHAGGEFFGLVPAGVRVVDLQAPKIRHALRPLRNYLRDERPDALLAAMWPLTVIALLAAAGLPARVVVSDHCALVQQYTGQAATLAVMRATIRAAYRFADGIVGVSDGVADEISSIAALPRARVTTIYNPVPPPLTSGAAPDALWNGLPGKRILSVGRFKAQKNHALLIAAFARLAEQENAVLAIVGTGELREQLAAQAAALGIADRVLLPGFCATPGDWYASADLFALSSNYEGLPLVLIEALHLGLPIVSTNCPYGPDEIIEHGRWGTLVPVGDAVALADAMIAALRAPADPSAQRARAAEFLVARAVDGYAALMLAG